MRLAIVTNTYPPHDISGVGTLVVELAGRLRATGHQAVVLTRRAPPGDPFAVATGGPKLLFPLAVARTYLRALRAAPFDGVHVHESDGVLVALLVRLARLLGRPAGRARLVATLQVSYRRERRSVRPVRAGGEIVSRPTLSERVFAWLRAPVLALLGRATTRLADRVVAPSRATAAELREDYGVAEAAVIANGVAAPPPAPAPAPRDPSAGGPVVLYAGRLRTRTAVAVLLAAFARLRAEHPAAVLVVAGDGEQRPALEAQARRLGIAAAVRFLGAQPRDAMPALYAAADLFCLPSLYEGFPLAILEAMAAGLPVVATAVAGVPEAVEHGVTGLLVPPEDAAALARALDELAADPERARRLGEAGRRRVETEYAIPRIAAAYLALWSGLLASSARSG
ncbi:MAG TPA: glycosyltransferase family 4 protein [Thermoanaerobaculia bacterium]|nr:glycosyltransferase family 4 protein [Thermoanaerobaculia bacterium]